MSHSSSSVTEHGGDGQSSPAHSISEKRHTSTQNEDGILQEPVLEDTTTEAPVDAEKALKLTQTQSVPPPDGGAAAWLVVLGAWCTSFCSFGWINSVGVFQEYYQRTILSEYPPSTIAWIPSLQIFLMTGMGPVIGVIFDRYGPRHLIFIGSILHVVGVMLASLGTEYYQIILAQGVCSAIGVSAIFQPALSCIADWFTTKRGAAYGILSTGSSLGGVIFPIMVSRLIDQAGFPWAMRGAGFLLLFLLVIANLTVRARQPPRPRKMSKEELRRPFTESNFVIVALGLLLFTFGLYVPINYLPVQAAEAGMDPNLVQYLIPILNAGSLFGRLGSGFAADKLGRYNVFITVCFFSGIWILALWLPDVSDPALIAFALLYGFFSGAYVSLIAALVVQISPIKEIGFRTGIIFLVTSLPGLSTNPINGAILDGPSGWVGVKVFSGVFCIAGTATILLARMRLTNWKVATIF